MSNVQDNEFVFLLEAYKIATDYFDGYASRVSTRFNILLGVDIALAGLLGNALLSSTNLPSQGVIIISVLGLLLSILLYVQSAQDKYVLKQQIRRINQIKSEIEKKIDRSDVPALFSPLDETDLGTRNFIFESVMSWRSNWLSLTRVPVVTSILFVVFWIVMIFAVS